MTERLTLATVALLLAAFVLLPLVAVAAGAADPAAWRVLGDAVNLRAALHTVLLCGGVLAFTLAVGLPIGWLLGRTDLPGRGAWRAVLSVPYAIPPYVGAIAWIQLLNPTTGLLNRPLASAGLGPLDIYGLGGMVWVLGLAFAPFVVLATADALARIDPSLEEAARMSGASSFRVARDVTLPLALPAVGASAGFVAAATAAAFGVPYLLASGDPRPDWVLTTRIVQALSLDPRSGRPVAVAMSMLLLVVGVGLPLLARKLEGRRSFVSVGGKAGRGGAVGLGRWRPVAVAALGAYAFVAAALPLGTIAATSLMRRFGGGIGPENVTLDHWREVLFERPDTLDAFGRSALLAALAATAAAVAGGLVAWAAARGRSRVAGAMAALARTPYAVPGTVLALGMLLCFSREVRVVLFERVTLSLALADTAWLLGIAYAVKHLAFPVDTASAAIRALDPSLEEAARMCGAGWFRTLRDVTVPLVLPALAAAWFLAALPSFSEITMSTLLYGPRTPVVGTVLFNLQAYSDPPAAAVVAVLIAAVVLVASGGARIASGGRVGL